MARTPSYRLHKPSGLAFIEIRGKRTYLGKHGTDESRKRFAQLLSRELAERGGAEPEGPGQTCAILIDAFLEHAEKRYVKNGQPTTEPRAFKTALSAVTELYAELPVDEFGPIKLMACRKILLERGYCRSKINTHVGRIVRCWKWGVSRELVDESTWRALTSVEGLRKGEARDLDPVEPVSLEHVNAIKDKVSPVVWGLIQLQLHTGCRPGEACGIRMCDLEMNGDIWEYRPDSHKTEHHGKQRVIFIGPKGQAALKPFLRTETKVPLFRPKDSKEWYLERRRKNDDPKPRKARPKRKPGDQFSAGSLGHAIHAACIAAKIPPWTPNQLRHAAATAIRAEFGIEASQVTLGHSTLSTTEIYAEKNLKLAKKIAKKLG